jgi:hypothetical protein
MAGADEGATGGVEDIVIDVIRTRRPDRSHRRGRLAYYRGRGRRAGWPVNVGLAYLGGRVRGVFVRVGSTTLVAGWWPR